MRSWSSPGAGCLAALAIVAAGCKPQSPPRATAVPWDAAGVAAVVPDAAVGVVEPDSAAVGSSVPDASALPDSGPQQSQLVTWSCTGKPCPWGPSQTNHAVVWPASMGARATRLGYTLPDAIYLPAAEANGVDLSVESGAAMVYAGSPAAVTHRVLATMRPDESLHITGIARNEVVSVQGDASFTYRVTRRPPDPAPTPKAARHRGRGVPSIAGLWRCNQVPGCFSDPWTGAVIAWPAWSAKQSNGRTNDNSRSVFSVAGEPLYPYMGAWAEGCEVTAEAGTVQIIEWQYGSDQWRTTVLLPGVSHVIHLVPPENGALIEAEEGISRFRVSLRDCTPQRIPP